MKILLISSTGGHFQALQRLYPFWGKHDCCWVTFQTASTELVLNNEKVYWAYSPTNRNLLNLIRNFWLAWQIIQQERPELVLSTGAGVAVPFIMLAKLAGIKQFLLNLLPELKSLVYRPVSHAISRCNLRAMGAISN